MSNKTREELEQIFVTGAKPTEGDFHDWMDSYWHKNDLMDSPQLTGVPTAPTAATTTNNTQIATTEFVQQINATNTFGSVVNNGNSTTTDINVNDITIGRGPGNDYRNTVCGNGALSSNTTGYSNVAVGVYALKVSTTGRYNMAVGNQAMYSNTTGWADVAVGNATLFYNTTGQFDVAVGSTALFYNTTGSNNTAVGASALYKNTTGSGNIGIGFYAGQTNNTGNYNIAIGYGVDVPVTGASNQMNIGNTIFGGGINGAVTDGKIGISVTAPSEKLEVAGAIKISNPYSGVTANAVAPIPAGGAGTIIFNGTNFLGWDGNSWKQLDN